MDKLNSYNSVLGGQSIEAVRTETTFIDTTARPQRPFYFSGDAAQVHLQPWHNQFLQTIYNQLDEDAKIVDALQSMMTAVDQRIVSNNFMDGENR